MGTLRCHTLPSSGFAASSRSETTCGLDEAGRGALAGPLVVAAVVFPDGFEIADHQPRLVVRDSKELTANQRSALYEAILEASSHVAVCVVDVQTINTKGINWANTHAFVALVRHCLAHRYIVDGRWSLPHAGDRESYVVCQIKADTSVPSVLAAGVVAKVWRDGLMRDLDAELPYFGWSTNTGHGTAAHIEAIRTFGRSPEHRNLFVDTALDGQRAARRRRLRQAKRLTVAIDNP